MQKTPDHLFAKHEIKFLASLAGILLVLLISSLVLESQTKREDESVPTQVVVKPFTDVNILAKAAYVYDMRTGTVLYSKNPDTRLPLASLTKVMSALIAAESASPDSTVVIDKRALSAYGDSGLKSGEKWSLKELLDFSLTSSSNDGMRAVALAIGALDKEQASTSEAENTFIRKMNNRADELGLKNTYYFNETGLDETSTKGGAYGSARDMADLFAYIFIHHPEILSATKEQELRVKSQEDRLHIAKNTDEIVTDIPGIKASKTGYTSIAGGNLVIVFDPEVGRPIVISVLGSTAEGRFQDMKQLVDKTLEAIHQ